MYASNINSSENLGPVPAKTGIGLRSPHFQDMIMKKPEIGFLEIHPENYFAGGIENYTLEKLTDKYSLSFHSVGLSLGASQQVDKTHLKKIKALIDKYQPIYISDHASWSASGNAHLQDLLPLPYNEETLKNICENISITQDHFGRQIFIENPSTYLQFKGTMSEPEFLTRAVENTGCKLLLDVNNIYVNSINHGFNPKAYLDLIAANIIGEVHLAGHSKIEVDGIEMRLDTHNDYVCKEVWALYEFLISEKGPLPTLIEWDADLPKLEDLVLEAQKCDEIIKRNVYKDAA